MWGFMAIDFYVIYDIERESFLSSEDYQNPLTKDIDEADEFDSAYGAYASSNAIELCMTASKVLSISLEEYEKFLYIVPCSIKSYKRNSKSHLLMDRELSVHWDRSINIRELGP
jgi:hypothetical protein